MGATLLTIRIFFFLLVVGASFLVAYTVPEWDDHRWIAISVGILIGALVLLTDVLLKGFSLRGLSALTFGIFIGWLNAFFIDSSRLFEGGDPQVLFIIRLGMFVILMYLGAVIALRGKDEFNLVIPYVRFVPHGVDVPLAVVDASTLIDGRIAGVCRSKFFGHALVIPRFVINELHRIADSDSGQRRERGRRGLRTLNDLRAMGHLDLRIHESDVERRENVEQKLVYLAESMRAKILTLDYNLAQIARFHHIEWLNINDLSKALHPELYIGEQIEVELVKTGKEPGQAVGYLQDGSMVVVNNAKSLIGQSVAVEVQSIIPSAGGKMVFSRLMEDQPQP